MRGLFRQPRRPGPTRAPGFEADVLPILQTHCTRCHGDKPRKAGLNLSSQEGALQGSESGPVIVPGKVEESLLWKMLREGKMPPGKIAHLSDAETATIRRWIARLAASPNPSRPAPRLNQHDVIPIMLRHCTTCHNHRRHDGDLDLTTKASMLRGGKSGPALVPGEPEKSLMLQRILAKANASAGCL